jgi:hypothetical protein
VSFAKTYEPPGYGYDKVFYEGRVNADATEISGRWRVGAALSGSFLMVRSSKTAEAVAAEEQAREPAR